MNFGWTMGRVAFSVYFWVAVFTWGNVNALCENPPGKPQYCTDLAVFASWVVAAAWPLYWSYQLQLPAVKPC